jgi:hypothetical protein
VRPRRWRCATGAAAAGRLSGDTPCYRDTQSASTESSLASTDHLWFLLCPCLPLPQTPLRPPTVVSTPEHRESSVASAITPARPYRTAEAECLAARPSCIVWTADTDTRPMGLAVENQVTGAIIAS